MSQMSGQLKACITPTLLIEIAHVFSVFVFNTKNVKRIIEEKEQVQKGHPSKFSNHYEEIIFLTRVI